LTQILDHDPRPPVVPANLKQAYERLASEARDIFIQRQKKHGSASINDVGLDDLAGVLRLKVARAKQQIMEGVIDEGAFEDSLLDLANYCYIILLVHRKWWNLGWKEGE